MQRDTGISRIFPVVAIVLCWKNNVEHNTTTSVLQEQSLILPDVAVSPHPQQYALSNAFNEAIDCASVYDLQTLTRGLKMEKYHICLP